MIRLVDDQQDRIDELVVAHLPLVVLIAKRRAKRLPKSVELDDIIQAGRMGLMKAAAKFDPERGSFEAFATFFIRGAIIDAFRRKNYDYELHAELTNDMHENAVAASADNPEAQLDRKKRCQHVWHAMSTLDPVERQVLTDRAEGKTYAEAAARHDRCASWAFYKARCAEGKMRRSLAMHRMEPR